MVQRSGFQIYSSSCSLGPMSYFQREVRTREPRKFPTFFVIKTTKPSYLIWCSWLQDWVPQGGYRWENGELTALGFYSALMGWVKEVAFTSLSHWLVNNPPQPSLSPAPCRDRVSLTELMILSVDKPQGLNWACSASPSPLIPEWDFLLPRRELKGDRERLRVSPLGRFPYRGKHQARRMKVPTLSSKYLLFL